MGDGRIRRVMMFAKYFPPCNCWPTASERAMGLARGLSTIGWTPVVITRALPPEGCQCGARHGDVTADREEGMVVIRVPTEERLQGSTPGVLKRLFLYLRAAPDDWALRAESAASRYVQHTNVDLVWTTAGPIVTTRLGRSFRRKFNVPWVAELRDSVWRSSMLVVRGRGAKARILRGRASLLARPLREADAIIHVSPQEAQADADLLDQPPLVVPSAFDDLAWSKLHAATIGKREGAHTLTVLFAGHAYGGRAGYSVFWEGVQSYLRSPMGAIRPIRVVYMGKTFDHFREEAQGSGMAGTLFDCGQVSLDESREAMRDADALLLVTAPEGYTGSPGGKLYEYLAACRPILAVPGTDEFVADVLHRTEHGVCAPNADAVCAALERLASGTLTAPSWSPADLQAFTWSARSRLLADIFKSVIAPSNGRASRSPAAEVSLRAGSHP